jgi:hypothetical protein
MRDIELPFDRWLAIIAYRRGTQLGYAHEHADRLERMLDETPPRVSSVRLSIDDDLSLRSLTLACLGLGIGLPIPE